MANQILAGAVINASMIIAGVDADNPPVTSSTPQNYFQASLSDWTIVAGSVSEPTSGTFGWTRDGGSGWVAGYEVSGLTVGTEYTISYEMRKTGGPGPVEMRITPAVGGGATLTNNITESSDFVTFTSTWTQPDQTTAYVNIISDNGGGSGEIRNVSIVGPIPEPAPAPEPAPVSEPQILPLSSAVSLLMDASATADGSVVDGSTNSHAITVNGDVSQSSFSPYRSGGYSWEFSTGYISKTADDDSLNFGSDDFTVEMWFNAGPQTANYPGLFSGSNYNVGGSASFRFDNINYDQKVWLYINGVGDPAIVTTNTYAYYQWHHTALVRNGTNLSIYVNGVQDASITISSSQNINFDHGEFRIGRGFDVDGGNGYFNGKIADVRAVRGTAVYTSDFTVPTERPTEVAGTSLLTCNLPYLQSGLTTHGDVSPVAAGPYDYAGYSEAKHGGSYAFDGNGDYLSMPKFDLGSDSFTVECWMNVSSENAIIVGSHLQGQPDGWYVYYDASSIQWSNFNNGNGSEEWLVPHGLSTMTGQWHHIAVAKDSSNTMRMFLNGVMIGSKSDNGNYVNSPSEIFVGAVPNVSSGLPVGQLNGSISDLRIVQGTAVYTEVFTPPTAPLEAVTGTSLLLSGNNAAIRDESQSVESISVFGNTTVADSSPYSTGKSITFDGNGDIIKTPYSEDFAFGTGDFTVEFWLNYRGGNGYRFFWNLRDGPDYIGYGLQNNSLTPWLWQDGDVAVANTNITPNMWQHHAVVRNNGVIKIYLDGTEIASANYTNNIAANKLMCIGGNGVNNTQDTNGLYSDFRVIKGTAVYTENFSVPTAPLGDYSES